MNSKQVDATSPILIIGLGLDLGSCQQSQHKFPAQLQISLTLFREEK